jgi:hypothetical protein
VILVKIHIPKSYEELNKKIKKDKVLMKNADLNELTYMELIVLIDVRNNSRKVVLSIIKGCKNKD